VYFKEGPSSNVLVTSQNEHYSLRVNGKVDASSAGDMTMQLGLAYLPMFLVPDARDIVIIGFGSGTTLGASLLFPDVKVTCCEIESGVFEASKFFSAVNHSPQNHLRTGRLRMVFDDGRSHLQGTNEQYDIILSEPSNPWIAGVSNLFTREFYQAAKRRLKPNGILAQWIQMYSFKPVDYAMIVATVMDSFSDYALIRISDGDTVLLAADRPLTASSEVLDRAQALVNANPKVRADLEKYFSGMTDVRSLLLNHLLLDKEALRDLVSKEDEVETNTDLNMKLEFDAPLRLFGGDRRKQVMKGILSSARADWFRKAAADFGLKKEHAPAIHSLSGLFDRTTQGPLVLDLVKLGLQLDPGHPALLTDTIILSTKLETEQFANLLDKLFEVSQAELNRLGVSLFQEGRHEQAAMVFEKLTKVHRDSVTTWNNLAVAYEAWGKIDKAKEAFERALSVDPLSDFAKKSFSAFKEKHGAKGVPGPGAPPPADVAKDPASQPDSAAGGAGGGNSASGTDHDGHDHDHDHSGHTHDSAPSASSAPPLGALEQSGAATP
jgi:spermidine synthase